MARVIDYERESVGLFFFPNEQGLGIQDPVASATSLDYRLIRTLRHTHTAFMEQSGVIEPKEWLISVIPASTKVSLVSEFQRWNDYSTYAVSFPDTYEGKELGRVWLPIRELYFTDGPRQGLVAFPTAQNGNTPLTLNQMRDAIPSGSHAVLAGMFDLPGRDAGVDYYPVLTKYSHGDPRSCLRQLAFLEVLNRRLLKTNQYLREPLTEQMIQPPDLLDLLAGAIAEARNGKTNGVNGHNGNLVYSSHT